jgi:hypothetical protein
MADLDRLRGALAALVQQLTGHTDYHAVYLAEVRGQNPDFTVELRPESPKLGDFSRVALRGLPGVQVRVKQGARVLLGFENGDPSRPYAALFNADSLQEIIVTAQTKILLKAPSTVVAQSEGLAKRVARMGDLVKVTGICGPPGAPVEFVGYILDGAQKLTSE